MDAYDEQWLRGKEAVTQIIQRRLPAELHGLIEELRGGLVFTHNRASLEIDPSCRAEYGRVADWANKIGTRPAVPNMTTEVLLRLVDALLEDAGEISKENSDRSAVQLAVDLYHRAENEIPEFVSESVIVTSAIKHF